MPRWLTNLKFKEEAQEKLGSSELYIYPDTGAIIYDPLAPHEIKLMLELLKSSSEMGFPQGNFLQYLDFFSRGNAEISDIGAAWNEIEDALAFCLEDDFDYTEISSGPSILNRFFKNHAWLGKQYIKQFCSIELLRLKSEYYSELSEIFSASFMLIASNNYEINNLVSCDSVYDYLSGSIISNRLSLDKDRDLNRGKSENVLLVHSPFKRNILESKIYLMTMESTAVRFIRNGGYKHLSEQDVLNLGRCISSEYYGEIHENILGHIEDQLYYIEQSFNQDNFSLRKSLQECLNEASTAGGNIKPSTIINAKGRKNKLRLLDKFVSEHPGQPISHIVSEAFDLDELKPKPRNLIIDNGIEPFASTAPVLWAERENPSRGDDPIPFIQKHYEPWLEKGFTISDVRRVDASLAAALSRKAARDGLPSDLNIDMSSTKERNARVAQAELEAAAAEGREPRFTAREIDRRRKAQYREKEL